MNTIMEKAYDVCLKNDYIRKAILHLTDKQESFFFSKIEQLNKNEKYLYKSKIHGLYHSEKVMLFAYLIGLEEKLNPVDLEIVVDAAGYHDIGRNCDSEDETHGLTSALRYDQFKLFKRDKSSIYYNDINYNLLKAITDFHSQRDSKIKINSFTYDIPVEEYDRYIKLASIIKDADALDRTRFSELSSATLNTKFLRFKISKQLVDFARIINGIYYQITKKEPDLSYLTYTEDICYHSIGRDYFKIASILEHGILSQDKITAMNLSIPKNFHGGNGTSFISVVPAKLYNNDSSERTASKEFLKKGIIFVCENQKLYKPLPNEQRVFAIENSLPYDKSNYADERYVYLQIPKEYIRFIVLNKEFGEANIKDLEYLYNSVDISILERKILYFLNNINIEDIPNSIRAYLNKYKAILDEHFNLDINDRREDNEALPYRLQVILEQINYIIANLINEYYKDILKKDDIKVKDVVSYELTKLSYGYDLCDGESEYIYNINVPMIESSQYLQKSK